MARSGLIKCPKCGYTFSIMYSRAYSCKGCYVLASSLTCNYVKCPRCGYEFPSY